MRYAAVGRVPALHSRDRTIAAPLPVGALPRGRGWGGEAGDGQAAAQEKGRAYGTPYYISPGQSRGLEGVDFRADIDSLGATF